ncbi:MAG: 5-dehydro-2-deoxygluconokinase [Stappiaceae bacterium]
MSLSAISKNSFVVLGRAGMDLYADPPGTELTNATQFFASMGGSAGNIAAGIVRLGGKAALLTAVSEDAVGQFVMNNLAQYGVEDSFVTRVSGECRTSLAVTETRIDNTQNVIYRNNAADFLMTKEHVDAVDFDRFGALIITGTALAAEPSRGATRYAAEQAREAGIAVILDVDYRPYSWPSGDEASRVYRDIASQCDMIIGNDEEFAVMAGASGDGKALAQEFTRTGDRTCIYKMGPEGSIAYAPGADPFETPIYPVEAIKPMGAGDSFMAALVTGLGTGRSLKESVRRGTAAAAMVVTGIGCAPAMPTPQELEDFLTGPTRV